MDAVDRRTLEQLLGADAPTERRQWDPPSVEPPERVFIVGLPRSGSTYLGHALARTAGVGYCEEPDNAGSTVTGGRAMRGLGLHPALLPDERCDSLRWCFDGAFGVASSFDRRRLKWARRLSTKYLATRRRLCVDPDRPRLPLRMRASLAVLPSNFGPPAPSPVRMVKTVHTALAIDWLMANFDASIIVTRRHPLDIVASWLDLGSASAAGVGFSPVVDGWRFLSFGDVTEIAARFGAPPPPLDEPDLQSVRVRAWIVGLLATGVERAIAEHPEIVVAEHEMICRDPSSELRHVARQVGLQWTDRAETFVRNSNTPGQGYELRRLATAMPGAWRRRLDPQQIADARSVLREFPWTVRYEGIHD